MKSKHALVALVYLSIGGCGDSEPAGENAGSSGAPNAKAGAPTRGGNGGAALSGGAQNAGGSNDLAVSAGKSGDAGEQSGGGTHAGGDAGESAVGPGGTSTGGAGGYPCPIIDGAYMLEKPMGACKDLSRYEGDRGIQGIWPMHDGKVCEYALASQELVRGPVTLDVAGNFTNVQLEIARKKYDSCSGTWDATLNRMVIVCTGAPGECKLALTKAP